MVFATMADHQVMLRHESSLAMERRWKTSVEMAPNCPRCSSSNTKFCYYNNYSFSQPRYFCKGCRRYWTKGGSLRNVPVGGGCRKSRRGKSVKNTHNVLASALNQTCLPENDEIAHHNRTIAGSDIDLAKVFANFLHNQRSSYEPEIAINPAYGSPKSQISPGLIGNKSDLSLEEIPWLVEQEQGDRGVLEDITENDDKITFQIQSFLEQEMATENDFWSDSMLHVPELQSFPTTDDHSGSFVGFNWCSFDLSGFEGFSRP